MRIDDREWPRVYCHHCQTIQPVKTELLPAGNGNNHETMDVLCATCGYIVATVHDANPVRKFNTVHEQ